LTQINLTTLITGVIFITTGVILAYIDRCDVDISQAELEVMQAIWEGHPVTAAEVVNRLGNKNWHEKTVKTFLSRLVKKGANKDAFIFTHRQ
jgi:predicted transcriptional regulator